MRAAPARLVALFAALVMLLSGAASARTQYHCRMMGRVIDFVCCGNDATSKATSPVQEVQLPDCCQRLSSSTRSAALGTLNAANDVAPAVQVATIPQAFSTGLNGALVSFCAESTQAPLAIGPPLFIVHW